VHGCGSGPDSVSCADQRGLDIPSHVFSGSAESRLVRVLVLGMEYRVRREWNGADPEWSCVNRGTGDKRTGDTGTGGRGDEGTRGQEDKRTRGQEKPQEPEQEEPQSPKSPTAHGKA
jgi:hypothetical protein